MKHTLSLPMAIKDKNWFQTKALHLYAELSGVFDKVDYTEDLMVERHAFQILLDGEKVALDVKDVPDPCSNRAFTASMDASGIYRGVKTMLVLQYRYSNRAVYELFSKSHSINVLPWSYFMFDYGSFFSTFPLPAQWENRAHKYLANMAFGLSGTKIHRMPWMEYVRDDQRFYNGYHLIKSGNNDRTGIWMS